MPIAPDQAGSLLESLVSLARTTRIIAHRDAERSVSGTPMALLQVLRDDEPRLGDLAERLRIKPSVASRAVAALETDGFVARIPDPADARACRIHLTDAGRAHLRDRQQRVLRLVTRTFEDFTPEDAERSIKLLKRLETSVVEWVSHVEDAAAQGIDPLEASESALDMAQTSTNQVRRAASAPTAPPRSGPNTPHPNNPDPDTSTPDVSEPDTSVTSTDPSASGRLASPAPTTRTAWEKTTA